MLSRDVRSLLKLLGLLVVVASAPGCGGSASPPASADAPGPITVDAGAAASDAGCGLSFEEATEAFAPERVCQTTVYDQATGYCTHWVACSSLY